MKNVEIGRRREHHLKDFVVILSIIQCIRVGIGSDWACVGCHDGQ